MFAQKLLRNVLLIDETTRNPLFAYETFLLENRNIDYQIILHLSQCRFSEQFIPVIKIYFAECSKRLEIGVYNYIFSDAI
jgi:hypothetical protein